MLAILSKQWIGMFVSRMRMPVPDLRYWAHRHRAYRDGLDRWKLTAFVSSLSVVLHLSLLLFLIGLIIYSYELDLVVFILVTSLSGLALIIYIATTLAPLLDGTCPTATPLLLHGREIVLWIWNGFRWSEIRAAAPFAESRVVSKATDVANINILAWIINNLPGEQDVDVALDAVAEVPPEDIANALEANAHEDPVATETVIGSPSGNPPRLSTATSRVRDPLLLRFRQLVNEQQSVESERAVGAVGAEVPSGDIRALSATNDQTHYLLLARLAKLMAGRRRDELEANAGELARAIRSTRRLGVWLLDRSATAALLRPLRQVRTHDVAVLSEVLLVSSQWAGQPPVRDMTHFVDAVARFSTAFTSWVQQPVQQRSISPVTAHTRKIMFDFLQNYRLSTNLYSSLVLTFCHEPDEAPHWINLATWSLAMDLESSTISDDSSSWRTEDIRLQSLMLSSSPDAEPWLLLSTDDMGIALQGWSSLLGRVDASASDFAETRLAHYHRAVQCFFTVLERRLDQKKWVPFPMSLIRTVLAPFTTEMVDTPSALGSAFRLLSDATDRGNTGMNYWSAEIAEILFSILDRSRRHRPHLKDIVKVSDVSSFLQKLLPSSQVSKYGDLIARGRTHGFVQDIVKHSVLNILTPRLSLDGSRTSIWRLAMSFYAEDYYFYSVIADRMASFSAQLTVIAALDRKLDVASGMFEQLLGDGYGTRCILEGSSYNPTAFEIARHVAMSAPVQWVAMRTELVAGAWRDTDHQWSSPAELIPDAEAAPPCNECLQAIEEVRKAMAQANSAPTMVNESFPSEVPDAGVDEHVSASRLSQTEL